VSELKVEDGDVDIENNGVIGEFESHGFTYKMGLVPAVPCKEDRFGADTVGKGANLSDSWCPASVNFTF